MKFAAVENIINSLNKLDLFDIWFKFAQISHNKTGLSLLIVQNVICIKWIFKQKKINEELVVISYRLQRNIKTCEKKKWKTRNEKKKIRLSIVKRNRKFADFVDKMNIFIEQSKFTVVTYTTMYLLKWDWIVGSVHSIITKKKPYFFYRIEFSDRR